MPRRGFRIAAGIALAMAMAVATPARADAIDGNWCSADSRTMMIKGPSIDTPGGNRITGSYSRHGFVYVIPEGEPKAGSNVAMTLVDENTIHLRVGETTESNKIEVWKRCELTT